MPNRCIKGHQSIARGALVWITVTPFLGFFKVNFKARLNLVEMYPLIQYHEMWVILLVGLVALVLKFAKGNVFWTLFIDSFMSSSPRYGYELYLRNCFLDVVRLSTYCFAMYQTICSWAPKAGRYLNLTYWFQHICCYHCISYCDNSTIRHVTL